MPIKTHIAAAVALSFASLAVHAQATGPAVGSVTAPMPPSLAYSGTKVPALATANAAPASNDAAKAAAVASTPIAATPAPLVASDRPARAVKPKAQPVKIEPPRSKFGTETVAAAKQWQAGGNARPVMGEDGLLQYPYGQGQVELTCAPLRGCAIQLQPGEVVNNVMLGDSVRWLTAPAMIGEGVLATQLVVVKPTEADLETTLLITTNRRAYTVTLRSSERNYVTRVGWFYPQDMVKDWNGAAVLAERKAEEEARRKVSDMPIAGIEQLNLDSYSVKGDSGLAWYPKRVFDDGTHVWIQMPQSMRASDAPALVLLDKSGNSELVNYRVKDAEQGGNKVTYYIVDKLFDRAGLIVGVGGDQQKVEIIRAARTRTTGLGSLFLN